MYGVVVECSSALRDILRKKQKKKKWAQALKQNLRQNKMLGKKQKKKKKVWRKGAGSTLKTKGYHLSSSGPMTGNTKGD